MSNYVLTKKQLQKTVFQNQQKTKFRRIFLLDIIDSRFDYYQALLSFSLILITTGFDWWRREEESFFQRGNTMLTGRWEKGMAGDRQNIEDWIT